MKILFHCWEFPPNGSGVGYYIQQMAIALSSAGHECVILTGRSEGYPEECRCESGLVLRKYSRGEIGSRAVAELALETAHQHKVDIIEGADHLGECASIILETNRPPVLIKVHSSNALKVLTDSQIMYKWQKPVIELALLRRYKQVSDERKSMAKADILFSPTMRTKIELIAQGLRKAEDIHVVPNPVTLREPAEMPPSVRPVILFVGRTDIGKGVQFLPDILREVLLRYPGAILEIAGGDSNARGLGSIKQWLIKQLAGTAKNVRFLGILDRRELDKAYSRATVVIAPSRWDNFPGAVLDAMLFRKPVVASQHGGMPEMLAGTGGCIADPSTPEFSGHICRFLGDTELCKSVGRNEREKVAREYSASCVAEQYIRMVNSIIK